MIASGAVSVVIPVYDGECLLPAVLAAIRAECQGRTFEIIAVDDGSTAGRSRYVREQAAAGLLRVVEGPRRGTAAAVNAGIREAQYPFICQIDQDVIVCPGWMDTLFDALADDDVAAAQGRYTTAEHAGFWARVMGRDLEQRYDRIASPHVDHVCTGNTIYRTAALHQVGLLDETFGYAADNDLSYRLVKAGYRLAFCRTARSVHLWREGWRDYLRQQFGVGYGRLDLILEHPRRIGGDRVSGSTMILHAAGMCMAITLAIASAGALLLGRDPMPWFTASLVLVSLLGMERLAAGFASWRHSGDVLALAFPVAHLARDAAWACAVFTWTMRRTAGVARSPQQSMARSRREWRAVSNHVPRALAKGPTLVLIPAHNEAASLPRVILDIRRSNPRLDILVVNDGSEDDTEDALRELDVRRVTLPWRTGVGGAIRTGIRYALRHGYDCVIRMDGDGQHRACDLARLMEPVASGRADAVVGSRYTEGRQAAGSRAGCRILAIGLSMLVRRRVTDPTSGYWVFGPRALKLLSHFHPTGYPEPELLLLLHRNDMRVEEIPIEVRMRLAGRTTLTWSRTTLALARTLLALVIVPLRPAEPQSGLPHE